MNSFDKTHNSFSRAVKHNWQPIAAVSVLFLTLGSCLLLPAQAFNRQDLDTVLSGKDCVRCDLSGADLVGRDLSDIILRNSNLSKADLTFSSLKNADLSGTNLSEANLVGAFLFGANLHGANLHRAVLISSYLHQADLSRSDLNGVDLSGAYLFDAKFSGANLSRANLKGTVLSGANLSETNSNNTIFKEALYDRSTVFPRGFDPKNAGLVASRSPLAIRQDPDRYNVRLAELHQLSFASVILMMRAYDGGCKDLSCLDPAIVVKERVLKLVREIYGEQSPEVVSARLSRTYGDKQILFK
jgi:uncharacterized protein YjbI with pentapeptide repeats